MAHVKYSLVYAEQNAEQAEEAVEHMCFLTDGHRLFDNALGLYDLELTLMVAQQAQRVRISTHYNGIEQDAYKK